MALVGKTQRHQVTHEPGEWIETRHLTWGEMEEARQAFLRRAVQTSKDFPAEMMETATKDAATAEAAVALANRPKDYDPLVLIRYAVTAWSYPEDVTPENIALLDGRTVEWLNEVVRAENTRDTASGEESTTS